MPHDYPDAPNGKDTKAEGEKYQEFIRGLLNPFGIVHWHFGGKHQQFNIGENGQGHEIKLDERCFSRNSPEATGRLSIEVQERKRLDTTWVNSGILRDDNSWLYVQGNYEIVFVFAKNWLRRVYHKLITPDQIHEFRTVRKFYLKIDDALIGAALVIDGRERAPLRRNEKGQWSL